jgi:hypothetical protein
MKVTQNVSLTFSSCYSGWSGLEIKDSADNAVTLNMSDEAYLKLETVISRKCDEIREKQAEALASQIAAQTQEAADE